MNVFATVIVVFILNCCFNTFIIEGRSMAKVVPSVNDIEQIDECLSSFVTKNDTLALFLDYDGTLSPIASHPSLTAMEPESETALKSLAGMSNVYLAIVSGRSADDAHEKVKLDVTYAGNHGLEINFANKSRYQHKIDEESFKAFEKMAAELETSLSSNGAWAENKKYSLTFHYRDVPEIDQDSYKNRAISIIEAFGCVASPAHKAVEAKPPVLWNKGEAALYILREEFGNNWAERVKVIFLGDDTTDEDAMRSLHGLGMSFRVSTKPDILTNADYRVPSTKTVSLILQWLQSTMSQA